MKHLLRIITLLAAVSLFAAEPWPGVQYTEVRAFAWDLKTREDSLIRDDFTLVDGVINKDGAVLNADQTKRLLAAQARRFEPRPLAGCYIPHNAFVFYNAEKKPVAFLEICFDCLGNRSQPADAKCDPDFIALVRIFDELKLPFGSSKTVKDYISEKAWILQPASEKK